MKDREMDFSYAPRVLLSGEPDPTLPHSSVTVGAKSTVLLQCPMPVSPTPEWFGPFIVAFVLCSIAVVVALCGRIEHWKSMHAALGQERESDTGWEDEARFWRRHFDADAEAAGDDDVPQWAETQPSAER